MDILQQMGLSPTLPVLFTLSFLAATVLPVGSEWLLILMILQDQSAVSLVLTATLGNYLGGCTTFFIGIRGSEMVIKKILRMETADLDRAKHFYLKYGSWSLLLSWLPVIGDPLCLLAGILKTGFLRFSILVFSGKFMRYATLAYLVTSSSTGH
jgi:membrane protein YqaA with SNARE-associated domain